jgi:CheY-like chemotaxis protein
MARTMRAPLPLPSLFGLTVLIVADDPAALHAARAGAFHLGLAVECAESGRLALETLRRHPVDAVLLALRLDGLDGLDGFETARAIRALETPWAGLPIVGLSATPDDSDVRRCREAGIDACLGKPTELRRLAQLLRRLCAAGADRHPGARAWPGDASDAHVAGHAAIPARPARRDHPLPGPGLRPFPPRLGVALDGFPAFADPPRP